MPKSPISYDTLRPGRVVTRRLPPTGPEPVPAEEVTEFNLDKREY